MFKKFTDTTICKMYDVQKIQKEALRSLAVFGGLDNPNLLLPNVGNNGKDVLGKYRDTVMVISTPEFTNVNGFSFPIILDDNDGTRCLIDVRNFTKIIDTQYNLRISKVMDYNNLKTRSILSLHWYNNPEAFLPIGDYAGKVFITWLSGMISRRYGLDVDAENQVTLLTAIYWFSLFENVDKMSDMQRNTWTQMVTRKIGKLTFFSASNIYNEVKNAPVMTNIHDYINALAEMPSTNRLSSLTLQSLLEIIGTSWYGVNARELLAGALEFPPVMYALVFDALNERGYRKSPIGQVALASAKHEDAKTLVSYIEEMLRFYEIGTDDEYFN